MAERSTQVTPPESAALREIAPPWPGDAQPTPALTPAAKHFASCRGCPRCMSFDTAEESDRFYAGVDSAIKRDKANPYPDATEHTTFGTVLRPGY